MLDAIDVKTRAQEEFRQLKLALVSSGNYVDAKLFEELQGVDDEEEITDGATEEGDPDATTWDFSNAQTDRSQAEVEREIKEMLAAVSSGTFNLDQPVNDDWV